MRKKAEIAHLEGQGDYGLDIVGESNYQAELILIAGPKGSGNEVFAVAELCLEPDNPHDPNAVRIAINGMTVGYLDRRTAIDWRSSLQANDMLSRRVTADAIIVGGWKTSKGESNYGVKLDIEM